ncbi:MAG: CoA transferase [Pseudomonadota bacterium]
MYTLLKDVRVLDLTSVVLGPIATQYLGDFGADVIKVEPPSGDIFRHAKPARSSGMGAGFLNLNRNKRSVSLDLKDAADLERFQALLDTADVLVHNMRPAAAERLGLDPASLRQSHPGLVYCTAPGFGSRGRNAGKPAYDDIIQAASGIADLNQTQDGAPRFVPSLICDKVGGLHLALAVLAGLVHRLNSGQGSVIEVPMFEGLASFAMAEQLAGETFVPAEGGIGYDRLMSPNRKPFATKDSYIALLPYNNRHWVDFLTFIGRQDLAGADWVLDASARSERVDELYAVIAEIMPSRSTAEWLKALEALDIPCTPVNALSDLLNDDHLTDVALFQEIDHPTEGALRCIRSPFWVEDMDYCPDAPAPRLQDQPAPIAWRSNRNRL